MRHKAAPSPTWGAPRWPIALIAPGGKREGCRAEHRRQCKGAGAGGHAAVLHGGQVVGQVTDCPPGTVGGGVYMCLGHQNKPPLTGAPVLDRPSGPTLTVETGGHGGALCLPVQNGQRPTPPPSCGVFPTPRGAQRSGWSPQLGRSASRGRPNSRLLVRWPGWVNAGAAPTTRSMVQREHREGHGADGGTGRGRCERCRAGDDGGTRGSGLSLAGSRYDGTGRWLAGRNRGLPPAGSWCDDAGRWRGPHSGKRGAAGCGGRDVIPNPTIYDKENHSSPCCFCSWGPTREAADGRQHGRSGPYTMIPPSVGSAAAHSRQCGLI